MSHPVIPNAPGLVWRRQKNGWACHWQARSDLAGRGFSPTGVRLWLGIEPSEMDILFVQSRANALQNEMTTWGHGGLPVASLFTGTIRSLIDCYQTDKDSLYHKKRYATRHYYDTLCRRIVTDLGDLPIEEVKARQMLHWHETISATGKVSMSHAVIGMLRTLVGFGATLLESDECARLSAVLSKMRFPMAKARTERLTADQAIAIRKMAHAKGRPSIALAQAFQFELMLRQKDVIGEWVPVSEPGTSGELRGNEKWLRGITWGEIDSNMILRHVTSKRQKEIEVDLRNAQMVMEELAMLPARPSSGPIVVNEASDAPYSANVFRNEWRKLANLCGIPKTVRNMDSRAGAISEATDAGADLEHVRQAATHSDIGMTQKYSRNATDKVVSVQKKRVEFRNKTGS